MPQRATGSAAMLQDSGGVWGGAQPRRSWEAFRRQVLVQRGSNFDGIAASCLMYEECCCLQKETCFCNGTGTAVSGIRTHSDIYTHSLMIKYDRCHASVFKISSLFGFCQVARSVSAVSSVPALLRFRKGRLKQSERPLRQTAQHLRMSAGSTEDEQEQHIEADAPPHLYTQGPNTLRCASIRSDTSYGELH